MLLLAAAPPNIDDVGVCASALLDSCVWCSMLSFFGFRVGGLIATLLYESPGGNQVDGLPPVCNARSVLASWHGRKNMKLLSFFTTLVENNS